MSGFIRLIFNLKLKTMEEQDYKAINEELKPQLKQTAVEWLVEEIEKHYIINNGSLNPTIVMELKRQAKQMEKDQIEDAWLSAWNIIMKPTNNESQTNL